MSVWDRYRALMQEEAKPQAPKGAWAKLRQMYDEKAADEKEQNDMAAARETSSFEDKLLERIRGKEAGSLGYDSYINFSKGAPAPEKPVSEMTLSEVFQFQTKLLGAGMPSSAVGGYQIVRSTLRDAVHALKIDPFEKFTPELQERIAREYLLRKKRKKGYSIDDYMEGRISKEDFAWSLSTEWASLPVLDERVRHTDTGSVNISRGQSFYRGVNINKSLFKGPELDEWDAFLAQGQSPETNEGEG